LPMSKTILCVDDNPDELALRRALLESRGFRVLTATEGFAALELALREPVALVVLDYRMRAMDGEAVAKALRANKPGLPILILSGYVMPERLLDVADVLVPKGESVEGFLGEVEKLAQAESDDGEA